MPMWQNSAVFYLLFKSMAGNGLCNSSRLHETSTLQRDGSHPKRTSFPGSILNLRISATTSSYRSCKRGMKKTPKLRQSLSLTKQFYECGTQKRLIWWGHNSWLIYFNAYAWFSAVRTPWHLGSVSRLFLGQECEQSLSTKHPLIFIRPLVTKYLWDLSNFVKFVFKPQQLPQTEQM